MNYRRCIIFFLVIALTIIILLNGSSQQDEVTPCLDVSFVDEIDEDEPSKIRTFVRDLYRKSASV